MKKFTLTHHYSFFSPNKEVAYILFKPSELIDFVEGQFLLLEKEINSKLIKRAYSIATTKKQLQKEWFIGTIVKRVSENGMSNYLVKEIKPGDSLEATGPLGHMKLDESYQNFLLVAIGSGLSPIFSIYQALIERGNFQKIAFLYGERSFDFLVPQVINKIKSFESPNVYNQLFLSREEREGFQKWYVQQGLDSAIKFLGKDFKAYLCGKPQMVEEITAKLMNDYQIPKQNISFEKY